jgi:hypothetical protein
MPQKFLNEETWYVAERYYKEEWRRESFKTFEEAKKRHMRDRATNKYDDSRIVKVVVRRSLM